MVERSQFQTFASRLLPGASRSRTREIGAGGRRLVRALDRLGGDIFRRRNSFRQDVKVWGALAIVYFVWGSTYLAIKLTVDTMPPLLSASVRFVAAGTILAAVLALLGRTLRIGRRQLAASALLGFLLLTTGVGMVQLAETSIDSGVAAIIASSVPLQVIAMRTFTRDKVARSTLASVAVGLAGVALVVGPGGGGELSGLLVMVAASVSWAVGSFVATKLPLPEDPFVATAYEMLFGGFLLLPLAAATGDFGDVERPSATSVAGLAYLAIAGSLVGFTAYAWLLGKAPISKVVTHQYVNPLVAVILGAVFLDEELGLATIAGAVLVVSSVFVVVRRETPKPVAEPAPEPAPS
jgi:drug/metabolite transporter (DMT)-like permease